jgi:hypothetical protein
LEERDVLGRKIVAGVAVLVLAGCGAGSDEAAPIETTTTAAALPAGVREEARARCGDEGRQALIDEAGTTDPFELAEFFAAEYGGGADDAAAACLERFRIDAIDDPVPGTPQFVEACEAEREAIDDAVAAFRAAEGGFVPESASELVDGGYLDEAPRYHDLAAGGIPVANERAVDGGC